jgi:hypothetical protein
VAPSLSIWCSVMLFDRNIVVLVVALILSPCITVVDLPMSNCLFCVMLCMSLCAKLATNCVYQCTHCRISGSFFDICTLHGYSAITLNDIQCCCPYFVKLYFLNLHSICVQSLEAVASAPSRFALPRSMDVLSPIPQIICVSYVPVLTMLA